MVITWRCSFALIRVNFGFFFGRVRVIKIYHTCCKRWMLRSLHSIRKQRRNGPKQGGKTIKIRPSPQEGWPLGGRCTMNSRVESSRTKRKTAGARAFPRDKEGVKSQKDVGCCDGDPIYTGLRLATIYHLRAFLLLHLLPFKQFSTLSFDNPTVISLNSSIELLQTLRTLLRTLSNGIQTKSDPICVNVKFTFF